jgi:ABC-type glycerol-3-phosphate transport system substrate-binding protein
MPDLVVWDTGSMRAATQRGLLQPMDEILLPDLIEDRFSFASRLGDVEGQTMGVVLAAELQHLAYRSQLVSTPALTWTGIISSETVLAFPAAGVEEEVNDFTLAQYLSAGGRLTDAEGNPQLDEEALTEVLTFYERAMATGAISPTVVLALDDANASWESFQRWEILTAVVDSQRFWIAREDSILPAPLPGRDGACASLADGWVLSLVTSDPDRQQAAMQLVEWLLAPEHSGPWTQAGGYLPATLSVLREWTMEENERSILRELLDGAIPPPDPATRAAVSQAIQTAVEAVLEGRRTPADAAAEAVQDTSP